MGKVKAGGGWAAVYYTLEKSFSSYGGSLQFWKRMFSKNSCKTCAIGMGGQQGGMTNEAGHFPEFCKKSVQAMAADLQPPINAEFFSSHSIEELAKYSPRELENLGRLAYPLIRKTEEKYFRRTTWQDAFHHIVEAMKKTTPNRTFFYSSGRSSNEAAFLLQWLARVYGTNNINNCSYYCHQASGVALGQSIGSGTATVTLDDLENSDFAMVIGANPASNHPRLITQLAKLRERGGKVVVVNPVRETGLDKFKIPSKISSLLFGSKINDIYVQPRIGGDIAFLKALLKIVIEEGACDKEYIKNYTIGFENLCIELQNETLSDLAQDCGISPKIIEKIAKIYILSKSAIFMWAMGITHHDHGVDNVLAITNLALVRGMVGKPHAGLMPIRGHSNVQGIGSVGFAPELKKNFLEATEKYYNLKFPTEKGLDSMQSVHAAHSGKIDFAFFLGGNFFASNPNSAYAAESLGRIQSSVHINTKLNEGHVKVSPQNGFTIILPTYARDEELQSTTQESMFNFVRLSEGNQFTKLRELKSEIEIITSIGAQLLPKNGPIDFEKLKNHDQIRQAIAQVVPGYSAIENIGSNKQEFFVEGRVHNKPVFPTPDGKAHFSSIIIPKDKLFPNQLRLMTIRSEGQFNTVVYEEHDRYRNQNSRDVILMNQHDMNKIGIKENDRITIRSEIGQMKNIRATAYDISQGSAAMYYPEANQLVSTDVDKKSGTPAFKNIKIMILV